MRLRTLPEWEVEAWLSGTPLSLGALRGQVVLLLAFHHRCLGCTDRALPQAKAVVEHFAGAPLQVIGLHATFEGPPLAPAALAEVLAPWALPFPIALDAAPRGGAGLPRTMASYGLEGTPSLLLIDAMGRLRRRALGPLPDLALGAELQHLCLEAQGLLAAPP